jgi:TolB-like protein/Tfp pilus assembly protein PilF
MAEARTQRRLSAILAADVVGYSRLMGEDEAGTLAALNGHRAELIHPTITQYDGRVVKLMGDGALVEFPSVVDAVECAVSIQRDMAARNADIPESKRIDFRVGINLGDIIIDGDDIYGNGVNVAARLEGLAEPGGICVSEKVYTEVRQKLDVAFEDLGLQEVKNIAEPVRAFRATVTGSAAASREKLVSSDLPSIAVLPFDNLSNDTEQEYFADGMAEDIITALSRFHWFYVAARHSSFIYKGKNVDVRQVGKDLGVRYVLEGSVRKGGDRLRINVQLVDTDTGNHLWAEVFDGTLADVFDLQDQITEEVVGAIEPSVQKAEMERARRKHPDSLDAYDLYLQALPHAWATTVGEMQTALDLLDKALHIDPDYASAHGIATVCCLHLFMRGGMDPAVREKAIRHCRAVIDSKTDDANALAFAGFIYATFTSDEEGAFGAAERAIALNPNGARSLTNSGMAYAIFGDCEKGIEFASRAIRLNPLDPMRYGPESVLSICYYNSARFAEAIDAAVRSLQSNSKFVHALAVLAASYVQLDRMKEAETAANRLLEIAPDFRASAFRVAPVGPPDKMDSLVSDLISAGLPE